MSCVSEMYEVAPATLVNSSLAKMAENVCSWESHTGVNAHEDLWVDDVTTKVKYFVTSV